VLIRLYFQNVRQFSFFSWKFRSSRQLNIRKKVTSMERTKVYTHQSVFYLDFEYDNLIAWNLGFSEKTEKYRQNIIHFAQNLVKIIFLDKEKKKKKNTRYTFVNIPNRHLTKKVTLLCVNMCVFYVWQLRFFSVNCLAG